VLCQLSYTHRKNMVHIYHAFGFLQQKVAWSLAGSLDAFKNSNVRLEFFITRNQVVQAPEALFFLK
jgi:hypothetical protein